ncbi:MAG: hypothetical protein AABM32_00065 [Chloroflexota bacterium]
MKRALITLMATLFISGGVVGSAAMVADARGGDNCSERGGSNNRNHDKEKCLKECDNHGKSGKPTKPPKHCDRDD